MVGTDLPEQRLLVLMDILGVELVAFVACRGFVVEECWPESRLAAAGARHE